MRSPLPRAWAAVHAALLGAGVRAGTSVVAAADVYGATYALLEQLFTELGVRVRFVDITDLDRGSPGHRRGTAGRRPVRDHFQSADEGGRRARPGRDGARGRRGPHRGQHLCQPLSLPPAGARRRLCRPLGDQVPGRPRRRDGRRGGLLVPSGATTCASGKSCWAPTWGRRRPGWRCAASRRCPCACASTAPTPRSWPSGWPGSRPWPGSTIPACPSHPQHALAARLFAGRGFGGMLSFDLRDAGQADVFRFMEALELVLPATTLGDVYSLTLYPAHSSHRQVTPEVRAAIGIGDGLVRLSVGIEDAAGHHRRPGPGAGARLWRLSNRDNGGQNRESFHRWHHAGLAAGPLHRRTGLPPGHRRGDPGPPSRRGDRGPQRSASQRRGL